MRVLVVDDDESIRRMLPRILRGFDVAAVAGATEGLALLAAREFDLVLSDYGLQPTDGLTFLQEVQRAHPTVHRYLMSGFDERRFAPHVASGLVRRVFPKPIDLPTLREALLAHP